MPKLELTVVGMQYRLSMQYRNYLRSRTSRLCYFKREPDNEYDPNAIMVFQKSKRIHLGYLTRQIASQLAPKMDAKRIEFMKVELVDVNPPEGEGTLKVQFKKLSRPLDKRRVRR